MIEISRILEDWVSDQIWICGPQQQTVTLARCGEESTSCEEDD